MNDSSAIIPSPDQQVTTVNEILFWSASIPIGGFIGVRCCKPVPHILILRRNRHDHPRVCSRQSKVQLPYSLDNDEPRHYPLSSIVAGKSPIKMEVFVGKSTN
jgi:hypothetical protein